MGKSSKAQKCLFCEQAIEGKAVEGFYLKKFKPRVSCEPCHQQWLYMRDHFGKGFDKPIIPAINVENLTRQAQQASMFDKRDFTIVNGMKVHGPGVGIKARNQLRENLSYCACGHKATQHKGDAQGNLLQCANCQCERFHYAALQVRSSDLITSGDSAGLVDTRDKLGKLRAMTMQNGASKEEYETALGRIAAILMRKDAA